MGRIGRQTANDRCMNHGSVVIRLVFETGAYSASENREVEC
jgi:hypothetical protein